MKNMRTSEQWLRLVILISGAVCAGLGLTVLVGWYTRNPFLIQILSVLLPMAPNVALEFFLCGTGLLAVLRGWLALTRVAGGLALLLGLTIFDQYIFGGNLGLDQMPMSEAITAIAPGFGHMVPTAAFGFVLSGSALLLVSSSVWNKIPMTASRIGRLVELKLGVLWLAGILIITVSFLTLALHLIGTISTYSWGLVIRVMPVPTAAGFSILGVGILAVAWYESSAILPGTSRWVPILVGAGALAVTLLLWQALLVQEYEHIEEATRSAATSMNRAVVARMDDRILALVRMGRRW
jgi:hypothetical protein